MEALMPTYSQSMWQLTEVQTACKLLLSALALCSLQRVGDVIDRKTALPHHHYVYLLSEQVTDSAVPLPVVSFLHVYQIILCVVSAYILEGVCLIHVIQWLPMLLVHDLLSITR